MINEKVITFIVITLSFSSTSGGMTRLCDIMDELIGSTSCVQEVRGGEQLWVCIQPLHPMFYLEIIRRYLYYFSPVTLLNCFIL